MRGVNQALIACAFSMSLLIGAVLSARPDTVLGVPVTGGVLLFPLTFSCLAVMAETYGPPASWRLAWFGVFMLMLAEMMASIATHLPPPAGTVHQAAEFDALFGAPFTAFALLPVLFAIGEVSGLLLYRVGPLIASGRLIWLRVWLVPLTCQVTATGTFMFLAVVLSSPSQPVDVISTFIVRSGFSVLYMTLTAPLVWAVVLAIRRSEQPPVVPELRYPEDLRGHSYLRRKREVPRDTR